MRHGSLVCLLLLACDPRGNAWPLKVQLDGGFIDAVALHGPYPCTPFDTESIAVPAGTFPASDVLVTERGDWVHVTLPSGPRWIHVDAPPEVDRAFVLGLREGLGCDEVKLVPFFDGTRAVVFADAGIFAVDLSSLRASMLDPRGADLESCAMNEGRTSMRCGLDLTFGSATVYPDGRVDHDEW